MTNFKQGVRFGAFHTYTDWGLILEADNIGFPVATGIVDSLDIYGQPELDPKVTWGRRQLSFTFGIAGQKQRWPALVRTVTNAIQGKKLRIIRDCETDVAYIGRCHVNSFESVMRIGKFVIVVDAEPYTEAVAVTRFTLTGTKANINYTGKYPTPCKAIITPTGAVATFTVGGLACNPLTLKRSDMVIRGLKTSKDIVIDGIAKTILEDGANKYGEAELWNFPMLTPGINQITFSHSTHSTVIEVYNRYI